MGKIIASEFVSLDGVKEAPETTWLNCCLRRADGMYAVPTKSTIDGAVKNGRNQLHA